MLKYHVFTVAPKTVDTATTSLGVWKPRCFQTPGVFELQCLETPGVLKHLVFGNTQTGSSRVYTIFGVAKHLFFTESI